jgi:membrane-associated phospholipid phosphatase
MENITEITKEKPLSDGPTETSSINRPWGKLAHGISAISNPLFVAFPTFLVIAVATAPDLPHALLWWMITVIGISIAPLVFVWRGVRLGRYSDHHVSIREQRFIPLLFGLGSVGIVFALLLALHASRSLIATVTAVIIVLGLSTAITRYWKISLHLVGMAGAVTAFVLLFGPLWLLLSPLVVLVGWARWQVHAHTPLQALAGTVLAVGVALAIFWLFGIH